MSGHSFGMVLNMADMDLKALLKRVVELVMPNLRSYYRVPRKGRIVKAYASDGSYWADVQPIRNDESDDTHEPVLPRIEIPILWGGPERGVVCPPTVGTLCDITYYDGDPDYPRISNFRWAKNKAPVCELGGFIIQQTPDIYIKITSTGNIIHKTTADKINTIGGSKNESVGANWNINVVGKATITAPEIVMVASTSVTATTPTFHVSGNITAGGNITATGNVADQGGGKTMVGMRTAYNSHRHTENGTGGGITNTTTTGM